MADPTTESKLKGLVLSAPDLRGMVEWPEALIEDYLNILDSFIEVGEILDAERDKLIEETPTELADGIIVYVDSGFLVASVVKNVDLITLTDGSIADLLHGHALLKLPSGLSTVVEVDASGDTNATGDFSIDGSLDVGDRDGDAYVRVMGDSGGAGTPDISFASAIGGIVYGGLQWDDANNILRLKNNAGGAGAHIDFYPGATLNHRMTGDGNFGVLTLIPATTFQVVGDVRLGDQATNYSAFASNGLHTLVGTARVKKIMHIEVAGTSGGASAPTFINTYSPFDGWEMDIGDDLHFVFEVPYDCDTSADIDLEIHWFINRAYADESGEVNWQGVYRVVTEDGTEPVDSGGQTGTLTTGDINIPATAKSLISSYLAIPAANLNADDVIGIDLSRIAIIDGNDPAGAPAADPIITNMHIEYTSNKHGEAT